MRKNTGYQSPRFVDQLRQIGAQRKNIFQYIQYGCSFRSRRMIQALNHDSGTDQQKDHHIDENQPNVHATRFVLVFQFIDKRTLCLHSLIKLISVSSPNQYKSSSYNGSADMGQVSNIVALGSIISIVQFNKNSVLGNKIANATKIPKTAPEAPTIGIKHLLIYCWAISLISGFGYSRYCPFFIRLSNSAMFTPLLTS